MQKTINIVMSFHKQIIEWIGSGPSKDKKWNIMDIEGIKPEENVTLFRGLRWIINLDKKNIQSFYHDINKDIYKRYIGEEYLQENIYATSWTYDEKIAEIFSFVYDHNSVGMILCATIAKEEVIIDLTYHNINMKEKEVIVRPGIYDVKVVKLFYDTRNISSINEIGHILERH